MLTRLTTDIALLGALSQTERHRLQLSLYVAHTLEYVQIFERDVAMVIALSRDLDSLHDLPGMRDDLTQLMSKRLVELLQNAVDHGLIATWMMDFCEGARKRRNHFVHTYFRSYDLDDPGGYAKAFWDVEQCLSAFEHMHKHFGEAAKARMSSLGLTEDQIAQVVGLVDEMQGQGWT